MRKVNCIYCGKSMDAQLYFLDFDESVKRIEGSSNKIISKIASYLFQNSIMCYGCISNMIVNMENLLEENENDRI